MLRHKIDLQGQSCSVFSLKIFYSVNEFLQIVLHFRAWAKNIHYDKRARMGISHFELYILEDEMVGNMQNIAS
jgi:hypothetical protein